jgi:hypothetical protein
VTSAGLSALQRALPRVRIVVGSARPEPPQGMGAVRLPGRDVG